MTEALRHELGIAVEAAQAAGALLNRYHGRDANAREKDDRTLVTDADLAAEQEILDRLRRAFPGDGILSEEAGAELPGSGRQWIVDPLDGTTNYSRGLPFFAVSIALWERDRPLLGVVYLPLLNEMFTAVRGAGAALNGTPIRVSELNEVRQAMVNVYFDRHRRLEEGLEILRRVALQCEGRIKMIGSTAGLLCYVACGRLDAFLRNSTRLWDFAAGRLILEEAGGRLTDFEGRPLTRSEQSVLASNGRLHEDLERILREPAA